MENQEQALELKCQYIIRVKTADVYLAGTNDVVDLKICGAKKETKLFRLDNKSNNFERNQTDTFKITTEDVGDITKIIIDVDKDGANPGWLLDYVEIEANKKIFKFSNKAKTWLTASDHGNLTTLTLNVDK